MYKQILDEDIMKKQTKEILKYIFTVGVLVIGIFIIKIFFFHNDNEYIYSSVMFIKQVKG